MTRTIEGWAVVYYGECPDVEMGPTTEYYADCIHSYREAEEALAEARKEHPDAQIIETSWIDP